MDRILSYFPKETVVYTIGGIHAVIFCGLFLWKLAASIASLIRYSSMGDFLFWLLVNDITNSEVLMGCVFSACLIIGTRKKLPGLVLTWMMSQVVFIICSLLTIIYFAAAPYLKISFFQASFEFIINVVLMACLYVVYTHFEDMRKGNLLNEEA